MHRAFETTLTRDQQSLNGRWDFVPDPDDEGRQAGYPTDFPDDTETQHVPGTWNTTPEYYEYEGPAWYRRRFHVPEMGDFRFHFAGIAHDSTVWVDGSEVVSHYGGYTPVEATLSELSAGEHEAVVRVDNTRSETSIPLPGTDWFPYGGITREVFLEALPKCRITASTFEYDLDDKTATIDADVSFRNDGSATDADVTVAIEDETITKSVTVPPGEFSLHLDMECEIELWSTEDPRLYDVVTSIKTVDGTVDDHRDRIGFRSIVVTDSDVLLNGDPVEIAGVNRHEDHPDWGHALPATLMDRDLDIIEGAGCNAVRTSHYPNHPRFLDYCDERGVLVIEEIPFWQYDEDDFNRGDILERGEQMLVEMIERDRHHPSVFAWSLHNECYNHEDGVVDATRRLANTALEHDTSRPLTLASNTHWRGHEDRCLEYVDFVSLNAYWGWYDDQRDWASFLGDVRSQHPSQPILVSEFGAGAVAGERTWGAQKWSEPYQAALLEGTIRTFQRTEYVAGWTIWQFCDTRTDPRKGMSRPKTKNNKGIVDEYRNPKEAYRRVTQVHRRKH